jgi:hypothetical protein
MDLPIECTDTTKTAIQNTSAAANEPRQSGLNTKQEPMKSEQRTDHDEETSSPYYTLLDLCRLTFTLDGVEVLNAQDATAEQFDALASLVADVTNVGQWYIEDRRDFINGLQAFCEQRGFPFPFTLVDEEKTPTAPLGTEEEVL